MSLKDIPRHTYRKARQLLIPFFVFGIVLTIYKCTELKTFILGTMKNSYWYLLTLFELYIFQYMRNILQKYISQKLLYDVLWICMILLILLFANMMWSHTIIGKSAGLVLLYRYWLYFAIASIIQKYNILDWLISNKYIFSTMLLVGISPVAFHSTHFPWNSTALSITYLYLTIGLFKRFNNSNSICYRGLNYLGHNTLEIYTIHIFFILATPLSFMNISTLNNSLLLDVAIVAIPTVLIIVASLFVAQCLKQSSIISNLLFYKG